MNTRVDELVSKFEEMNSELIEFVSGLTETELSASGGDEGGATVGEVVAHLGEGAPQVLAWLAGTTNTPAPAHDHHDHGHGHGHTHQHSGRQDLVDGLRDSLARVVDLLRTLDDKQLDSKPAAAPGITDGRKSLFEVVDLMIDHQADHLAHMRTSVSFQADGRTGQGAT